MSTSSYLSASNNGTVAVIDGGTSVLRMVLIGLCGYDMLLISAKLLLTPFRHVTVPPPMSAHQLTFLASVLAVAFAPPPNSNDFAVLLSDGRICFVNSGTTQCKGHDTPTDTVRPVTTPPSIQSTKRYVWAV